MPVLRTDPALRGPRAWRTRQAEVPHLQDEGGVLLAQRRGASIRRPATVAVGLVALLGCGEAAREVVSRPRAVEVERVVDGDTIRTSAGTVRLLGIDTPETVHPRIPDECGGAEASARLKQLAEGQSVRLVKARSGQTTDRYGRLLRYVELERRGDDDLGRVLVREGHAEVFDYRDQGFSREASYRAAEGLARAQGRGMWSQCGS